jgi:hypothetical protein
LTILFHLRPQLRALREAACAQNRVRVYAAAGFVPNSYRYTCKIQYIEARITDDRVASIGAGWCGAQRSGGRGALVVVQ